MDFGAMPVDVFEDILARIDDVSKLVGLRGLNKRFRNVLLSPTFAAAFNQRDHPAQSWLMAQVLNDHNDNFGILLGFEQIVAQERRTFQIPLEEIVAGLDVRSISLLAACGSLVLFKCVATENWSSFLIVLNLYDMNVLVLDDLPAIDYYVDFDDWIHQTFQCVTDIHGMISFDISQVALHYPDHVPRRLEFNSVDGWITRAATPLEVGDELIEFNSNYGMIYVSTFGAMYKVSSQFGDVVFREVNLIDMMPVAIYPEEHEHVVVPVEGWNYTDGCFFGKDGFAVLFQAETNPAADGVSRLRAICLYKLTPDWDSFEDIATVPGYMIPPNLRAYERVRVQRSDNIVNITFLARERDEDGFGDGQLSSCILQFWYNLETWQWGSRYTPLHDFDRVSKVVVTPSLTVGYF